MRFYVLQCKKKNNRNVLVDITGYIRTTTVYYHPRNNDDPILFANLCVGNNDIIERYRRYRHAVDNVEKKQVGCPAFENHYKKIITTIKITKIIKRRVL